MGAIQNSMNSLTATAAAAALAYDKSLEAKKLQQEQGTLAKQQYYEASADLTNLQGEAEKANKALQVANENVEATKGWNMEGANSKMLEGKVDKRLTEQQAADRAFKELQDRISAKQAMMSRAEKIMKRTGMWGGMR